MGELKNDRDLQVCRREPPASNTHVPFYGKSYLTVINLFRNVKAIRHLWLEGKTVFSVVESSSLSQCFLVHIILGTKCSHLHKKPKGLLRAK